MKKILDFIYRPLQKYFCPLSSFILLHVRTSNSISFKLFCRSIGVNRAEYKCMPQSSPSSSIDSFTHLQWTTMGPASGGLQAFTLRRKARMGVGYSGTPWSGHAMNWNCLTSLFSLEPFCRRIKMTGLRGVP